MSAMWGYERPNTSYIVPEGTSNADLVAMLKKKKEHIRETFHPKDFDDDDGRVVTKTTKGRRVYHDGDDISVSEKLLAEYGSKVQRGSDFIVRVGWGGQPYLVEKGGDGPRRKSTVLPEFFLMKKAPGCKKAHIYKAYVTQQYRDRLNKTDPKRNLKAKKGGSNSKSGKQKRKREVDVEDDDEEDEEEEKDGEEDYEDSSAVVVEVDWDDADADEEEEEEKNEKPKKKKNQSVQKANSKPKQKKSSLKPKPKQQKKAEKEKGVSESNLNPNFDLKRKRIIDLVSDDEEEKRAQEE